MAMEDYIRQSRDACEHLLHDLALIKPVVELYQKQKPETIWLVASGSSYNACVCAQALMNEWMETDVEVRTPFTFLHYTPSLKRTI